MIPFAEFTLGAALLTVLEIFLFIAWIWVLVTVIGDLFGDHTVSGWGKAAWTILLILVPFLGVF
ncbi:MAG TPA: PLDc N-terminal domain-containing protein, partial [Solirubrobacterales bacterium]